ncbi:replication initiation protein [Streptomyces durbertensis]|uniref:Replication initiation protein n=1 Tax=Streptomyces durbertensis TaxID=2448886 RepID=A0ABR6ENN3_9ACTN|nr:replication initiator [Streptomyces durbertensis]MBB1246510.1 replication initiation protein [Streptomyces durbertensis]
MAPPRTELHRLAAHGQLPGLLRQLSTLGGCSRPIRLAGHRTEHALDTTTGEIGPVLHHLESTALPAGQLLVRCNNRRATRCATCAETYRRDTYHLITAGLRGGKGTPEHVAAHPRVFATFTAPGFGPVHNRPTGRPACRCGTAHHDDDPALGTPLNPDTYDYEAAVLWNAHAGALWRRFSIYLRREVAKRAGLSQRTLRHHARVSFAKVAEYQRRGAVHFHAVIRLDGPDGGTTPPPPWATAELLTDAIRAAAHSARVTGPTLNGREHVFAFGAQLDIRVIRSADFTGGAELTDRAVAGYIAKYATKGAEAATGALDHRIRFLAEIAHTDLTDHARRMIRTCWELGARRDLEHLRLRAWAHRLGFRGHFSTKTRRYSTTLGTLRQARADWRRLQAAIARGDDTHAPAPATLVLAHWAYAGTGLTKGERWLTDVLHTDRAEGDPTHG